MFQTADTLLGKEGRRWMGAHIISYEWEGFSPQLLLFDQESRRMSTMELTVGQRIDWKISEDKVCTGSFPAGDYRPCPRSLPVSSFDQCRQCSSSWIGVQECVFEPQCEGERCDSAICRKEHTIYMAFFGTKAKIGMTTSARLQERGTEQGADAIGRLATTCNRKQGRALENAISKLLKLPQIMRVDEAVKAMTRRSDPAALDRLYEERADVLHSTLGLQPEPVMSLDRYPLRGDLGHLSRRHVTGRHVGEIVGVKGKLLAYRDDEGGLLVIQASSLPSHFLRQSRAKG
jgi:hypothetical protein